MEKLNLITQLQYVQLVLDVEWLLGEKILLSSFLYKNDNNLLCIS